MLDALLAYWTGFKDYVWSLLVMLWSYLEPFFVFLTKWILGFIIDVLFYVAEFFGGIVIEMFNEGFVTRYLSEFPQVQSVVSSLPPSLLYVLNAVGITSAVKIILGAILLRMMINVIESVLLIRFLSK